jgi:Kinesin motor domain
LQSHDLKHSKRFEFDEVFEEQVSQESFYAALKLNQLLGKVIEGFNATIFAYGPTGSGKTYTMEGYEYDKALKPIIIDNERVGLIPRITKNLFELLKTSDKTIEYTVYCTFIQIYKENVYDLLNPAHLKGPGLKLRWNKQEDFYLENLFMHPCYTYNEILSLYHTGLKNKFIASHNANSFSSRSHCILSLNIEGIDTETGTISTSKLQLVDLAGSEKVSQTGNEGMALKESIEINKALFTLRQVINNLALVKDGEAKYIPYRDSKLTSLLKQSIGGNSYCLMVACIAPMDYFFEDNLSTLSYAKKASCISNEPVKNTDPKTKLIKSLRVLCK